MKFGDVLVIKREYADDPESNKSYTLTYEEAIHEFPWLASFADSSNELFHARVTTDLVRVTIEYEEWSDLQKPYREACQAEARLNG